MRNDLHNAHAITHDAKGLHIEYPHTALVWQYDGNAVWRQKAVFQQGSWNKPSKSLFAKGVNKSNFIITSLSHASQAVLVTWQANDVTFLFCSRNGLLL